jgi:hypothetical protein
MKIKTQENYADKQSKHDPTPPCAPGDAGENLSGVPVEAEIPDQP